MIKVLTIDAETHYSKTYSLSKMTTEQYLRDPQYETIGVSVKDGNAPTQWFSGTKAETKIWLDQFPWEEAIAVAHNAMFDMAILNWEFDIRPKRIVDTLSMARALHGAEGISLSLASLAEKYRLGQKGNEVIYALGKRRQDFTPEELSRYGAYCCNDVDLTYALFQKLGAGFPLDELKLIDLTIRMFTEPVLELDQPLLERHLEEVKWEKAGLLSKALIDKDNLMSNPKLAQSLLYLGVMPPMKISPTTGKPTYAFAKSDEEFKALLEHENVIVQNIVAARLGVKSTLEETRTERFIEIAKRGPLPIPLRYYAAHTGRFGGDDKVNMQNLPRGSELKNAIRAPAGYQLADCDSSQIEARILAWLAGQHDLVEVFEKNNAEILAGVPKAEHKHDPYRLMASQIYGKPYGEITGAERQVGKVVVLAAGFGIGWKKLKLQLKADAGIDMPSAECERIISVYRAAHPAIVNLWAQATRALEAMMAGATAPLGKAGVLEVVTGNKIKLPSGMHLHYPGLHRRWNEDTGKEEVVFRTYKGRSVVWKRIWGSFLTENVTQALARVVVCEQMLLVAKRYRPAITVHDSAGALIPEEDKEKGSEYITQCFRTRPAWCADLPLNCEIKIGATYGG